MSPSSAPVSPGLCAARELDAAGVQVLALEAQERVGGCTLTEHIDSGAFIDHGGQWMSPGQERIVALAEELGVSLFPNWDAGLTVDWSGGVRTTYRGMFPPGSGDAEEEVREGARQLTRLTGELPLGRPWEAPRAADWDGQTYHQWLAENIPSPLAQQGLARALEGIFGGGPGKLSLLAALAIIRSGAHEITRLVSAESLGPERRFVGGDSPAAPTVVTGRQECGPATATPWLRRSEACTGPAPRPRRPGTGSWRALCTRAGAPQGKYSPR